MRRGLKGAELEAEKDQRRAFVHLIHSLLRYLVSRCMSSHRPTRQLTPGPTRLRAHAPTRPSAHGPAHPHTHTPTDSRAHAPTRQPNHPASQPHERLTPQQALQHPFLTGERLPDNGRWKPPPDMKTTDRAMALVRESKKYHQEQQRKSSSYSSSRAKVSKDYARTNAGTTWLPSRQRPPPPLVAHTLKLQSLQPPSEPAQSNDVVGLEGGG